MLNIYLINTKGIENRRKEKEKIRNPTLNGTDIL